MVGIVLKWCYPNEWRCQKIRQKTGSGNQKYNIGHHSFLDDPLNPIKHLKHNLTNWSNFLHLINTKYTRFFSLHFYVLFLNTISTNFLNIIIFNFCVFYFELEISKIPQTYPNLHILQTKCPVNHFKLSYKNMIKITSTLFNDLK